jgi:hypothetical protein
VLCDQGCGGKIPETAVLEMRNNLRLLQLYSPGKDAWCALYRKWVIYGPPGRNDEETIPSAATTLISSVHFLANHSTKLTQLSRLKHFLLAKHVTESFTPVLMFFHDHKFRHAPLIITLTPPPHVISPLRTETKATGVRILLLYVCVCYTQVFGEVMS